MTKTMILLLGSAPSDQGPLHLTQEFEDIDDVLLRSKHRDSFEVRQRWEMRTSRLVEVILRHGPRVLHFSGHGNPSGELLFQDTEGTSQAADIESVGDLFRVIQGVQCVVLNACFSARQARVIAKHVDVVVGMGRAVADSDAIAFSTGFYGAIGNGASVAVAVELARCGMALQGVADEDVPQIFPRSGVDPKAIFLHCDPVEPDVSRTIDPAEVEQALTRFFCALFGADELRQRIGFLPGGHGLRARLPTSASEAGLAQEAARLMMEKGALTERWFMALAAEIPGQKQQIMAMRETWKQWTSRSAGPP